MTNSALPPLCSGVLDIGGVAGSPAAAVRRAIGLISAGVDGIEIYESEIFAAASHYRWLNALCTT